MRKLEEALSSAFRILSNTFTIIIDLRNNGGGQPEYMEYCLAYFFDKPTHINSFYRRDTDEMEDFWTVENIPGKKMPDIPLFVLTSDKTFSGGEEFTYDLQALKRAKIIGDTTAGGAHPARTWDLYKNMFIMIPFGRAVNPVTGTNWEGVGVIPDIPVIAENALDTAKLYAKLSADQYWNDRKEIIIESYNEFLEKLQIAERTYTNNPKKAANMIYSNLVEMSDSDIFDQMAIDRLGYKYLDKGNIQMAIEIFKSIVRIYPESANVYDSLGEAYYENKDWERAISNYEKALELIRNQYQQKRHCKNYN